MLRTRHALLLAAFAATLSYAAPSQAQTVIDRWSSVRAPTAPTLKSVTLDPKTTALLVMDLVKQTCNEKRPACLASLPHIEKLVDAARAEGVLLIYTTVPPVPISDTLDEAGRKGDEPVVSAWVDKFTLVNKDTGLEKMLKDKGITTVIAVGTSANGAVLYTGSSASLRGFKVVIPVDDMSSAGENDYIAQSVIYNFATAPIVSSKVTLTSTDMIKFQ